MEGTILSEGQVTIAPTGVVKGAIHAQGLCVMGRVEGAFKVAGCLEILGTGWVEGEVELDTLVVDQGGTLQGSCARTLPPVVKEPLPFVPRRDERVPERPGHPASGTHGPSDAILPGRGPGWTKP
jgi:cytoskeletal protein CcmA (bactofilin family)